METVNNNYKLWFYNRPYKNNNGNIELTKNGKIVKPNIELVDVRTIKYVSTQTEKNWLKIFSDENIYYIRLTMCEFFNLTKNNINLIRISKYTSCNTGYVTGRLSWLYLFINKTHLKIGNKYIDELKQLPYFKNE